MEGPHIYPYNVHCQTTMKGSMWSGEVWKIIPPCHAFNRLLAYGKITDLQKMRRNEFQEQPSSPHQKEGGREGGRIEVCVGHFFLLCPAFVGSMSICRMQAMVAGFLPLPLLYSTVGLLTLQAVFNIEVFNALQMRFDPSKHTSLSTVQNATPNWKRRCHLKSPMESACHKNKQA